MGSIETAFGSEGCMKTKNVHVGNLFVHDKLTVDNEATFKEDVKVQGTVIAENGVKIGNTMFTEDKLNKSTTGVSGVMDTWTEPPSDKKFKQDNSGRLDSGIPDDPASDKNILMADTILTKNQIVTRTGLLVGYTGKEKEKANKTTPGSEVDDSFILPDRMSSENMYVDNIHERTKDKGVNVQNTLYVGTVGTKASGGAITIDADVKLKDGKSMGSTTLTSVVTGAPITKGPLPGDGDLIVQGNATFKKAVTFEDPSNGQNTPTVKIPKLEVDYIQVNQSSTGAGSTTASSATMKCDNIKALTDGKSISVLSPLDKVEMVVSTESGVQWDTNKFFRENESFKPSYDKTKMPEVISEFGKCFSAAFIDMQLDLLMFSNGMLLSDINRGSLDWVGRYSSLYIGNIIEKVKDTTASDDTRTQWKYYADFVGNHAVGQRIFDTFKMDRELLKKFVKYMQYLISNRCICGISTIDIVNIDTTTSTGGKQTSSVVKITFPCQSNMYNCVAINLDTYDIKFYRGDDIDNTQELTLETDVSCSVGTDTYTFYPWRDTVWNMLEYIVFYSIFYCFHIKYGLDDTSNPKVFNYILRKWNQNLNYNVNWTGTGTPPTIDNFENLGSYIRWWQKKDEQKAWQEVYLDHFLSFINSIDLLNPSNKLNFFNSGDVHDDLWKLVNLPGFEWIGEKSGYEEDVLVIIRRGEGGTVMEVRNSTNTTPKFRITTPNMVYPEIEIGSVTGDLTVNGNFSTNSITSIHGGPININSASFEQLYINGSQIKPDGGNTPMNMGFAKPTQTVLYKEKCIGSMKSVDSSSINLVNENNVKEKVDCPDVIIDYNFCGTMYFFTVRTFFITRRPLIDEYVPSGDVKSTGFGRIVLPVDAINPYSFEIIAKKRSGADEDKTTGIVTAFTPGDLKSLKCSTNADNYYAVAMTNWQWIKYEVKYTTKADGTKEVSESKYVLWHRGYVIFYTTEEASKHLNLEWRDYPSKNDIDNYKVTDGYTLASEFVVVEGFRFAVQARNDSENYGYYKNIYYK